MLGAAEPITGIITDRDWLTVARRLQLSPQQALIARLIIVDDLKNAAIARRLCVAPRSVETQLERAFAKLGVHSRTGLAVRVLVEVMGMEHSKPVTAHSDCLPCE